MNTTFNSALKQRTTIRKDLSLLSNPTTDNNPQQQPQQVTPAALGSLSASLTAFARTIDEYHALAKQELNKAKQEKALERIRDFRAELADFRAQLDTLKAAREEAAHAENRSELLGRRPFAASTPENPYNNSSSVGGGGYGLNRSGGGSGGGGHARTTSIAERGIAAPSPSSGVGGFGMGSGDVTRESHALREQAFFASTHSALDEYIARGQAVLGDLGQQREMLKSTQRKLYSVGNTLGISGDTIRMIERRRSRTSGSSGPGSLCFSCFAGWCCIICGRDRSLMGGDWWCFRLARSSGVGVRQ
ncbi:uncharacterized protein B0T15DRAFT_137682 [Chaetomium strumarium]|uniref:Protein transport protein BOS1 n=1 Tax=Chaetomium strumarium TaxID=1170767 RepID=A0AAJ0GUJ1_9PEZI|nr:hypothetical protein B0T15DRAFT_137682 [Chaetomium strumarium]